MAVIFNSELSDSNWGYFAESVFSYDQFEALEGFFFFDKQAYAKTEDKGEGDHNNQVCHFFRALEPSLMEVKPRRFQVFEQGFYLESSLVVMAGIVSQIQVCQQEKGLWVSFFQPIHGICQGQCAFNEINTAGGSHRVESGYLAIKINEAIRGCPHYKQPLVRYTPLLQALAVEFSVAQKHHPAPGRANWGYHFE